MESDSDAYMHDVDSDFDADDDVIEVENIKPAASNKARGGKKSTSPAKAKTPKKKKTVEEIYQKKTQLEHILLRPDTYSTFSLHILQTSLLISC
jgi:DNA topoisomerase-2